MSGIKRTLNYALLLLPVAFGLAGILNPAQAEPRSTAIGFWSSPAQGWVIETAPCDSGICGFLVSFRKGKSIEHVVRDSHNPDPMKRGTPLCGLMLLGGFTPSMQIPEKLEKGWVYDPETGSTYTGVAQVIDADTISVRGYVIIPLFGRTLTLVRAVGEIDRCSVHEPRDAVEAPLGVVTAMSASTRTGLRR